jgi:hypothetical protein
MFRPILAILRIIIYTSDGRNDWLKQVEGVTYIVYDVIEQFSTYAEYTAELIWNFVEMTTKEKRPKYSD